MSSSDLAHGLSVWLTEHDGRETTVRGLEVSPAGARRVNALFDAVTDSGTTRLALTLIPSAAVQVLDVSDEARVRTFAASAGVPVPEVTHVCTDDSVLGGPFFLSTAVDGETVPRRVLRLVQEVGNGDHVVEQLGHAIARLQHVDPAEAPAALEHPPHDAPVAAALARLDEEMEASLEPSPTVAYGIRWLERNAPPEPARMAVVHSDIRTGNIIVGEDGLRAILDWETARIGDPMEDVAWPCVRMWRFRQDSLTVGGIGQLPPFRDAYVAAGGEWDDARFRWWQVHGTVRWCLGLATQARQHLDGTRRSIVMAASGRRVPELEYDILLLVRPS